jgi:hypothetical protein
MNFNDGVALKPGDNVRMVTERQKDCVIYEVIIGELVRWRVVVDMPSHGKKQAPFRMYALQQERIAYEYAAQIQALRDNG